MEENEICFCMWKKYTHMFVLSCCCVLCHDVIVSITEQYVIHLSCLFTYYNMHVVREAWIRYYVNTGLTVKTKKTKHGIKWNMFLHVEKIHTCLFCMFDHSFVLLLCVLCHDVIVSIIGSMQHICWILHFTICMLVGAGGCQVLKWQTGMKNTNERWTWMCCCVLSLVLTWHVVMVLMFWSHLHVLEIEILSGGNCSCSCFCQHNQFWIQNSNSKFKFKIQI